MTMNEWRYPLCGVLLGVTLYWAGLTDRAHMRQSAAGKSWSGARLTLYALGVGMGLTALLCWLAVIDVERIRVAPLHGGVLLGGALLGTSLGLCGASPMTMLAGAGGRRPAESLCGAAGCVLGAWLADLVPKEALWGLFAPAEGTLFRLTLVDQYLLGGGFAALAGVGAALCVLALFVRRPRQTADAEQTPENDGDQAPTEMIHAADGEVERAAENETAAEARDEDAEP